MNSNDYSKFVPSLLSLVHFACTLLCATPVCVMTFNTGLVCVGPGCIFSEEDEPRKRAPLIGQWLKEQESDVVFLQEVFQEADRETIRRTSSYPYLAFTDKTSGLVILSKHPLKNIVFEPYFWQGSSWHDCRRLFVRIYIGMLHATMVLPEGKEITVVNTHQLARWPDTKGFADRADIITPEREIIILQMMQSLSRIGEEENPIIFSGDFNMNQKSEEYSFFSQIIGLEDTMRSFMVRHATSWEKACTFCPDNHFVQKQHNPGEGVLDYIWIQPGTFDILNSQVISAKEDLSDHRAVTATLSRKSIVVSRVNTPWSGSSSIQALIHYISGVKISSYCWFTNPTGWTERKETVEFLKNLQRSVPSLKP